MWLLFLILSLVYTVFQTYFKKLIQFLKHVKKFKTSYNVHNNIPIASCSSPLLQRQHRNLNMELNFVRAPYCCFYSTKEHLQYFLFLHTDNESFSSSAHASKVWQSVRMSVEILTILAEIYHNFS
jgi:hypothetical protein